MQQSEMERESPFVTKLKMISDCNRTHSKNMYFLSVLFSRTSITCGTDGILFPQDLQGMKGQMINKEGDASDLDKSLYPYLTQQVIQRVV